VGFEHPPQSLRYSVVVAADLPKGGVSRRVRFRPGSWAADSACLDQVRCPSSEASDWSFQHGLLVFQLRSGRKPRSLGSLVALEVVVAVAVVVETAAGGGCTAAVVSVAGVVNFGSEMASQTLTGAGTAMVAAAGVVALVLRCPAYTATSVMTSGVERSSRIQLEAVVSDIVSGAVVDVLVAMGLQCPADTVGLAGAATTAAAAAGSAAAAAGDEAERNFLAAAPSAEGWVGTAVRVVGSVHRIETHRWKLLGTSVNRCTDAWFACWHFSASNLLTGSLACLVQSSKKK